LHGHNLDRREAREEGPGGIKRRKPSRVSKRPHSEQTLVPRHTTKTHNLRCPKGVLIRIARESHISRYIMESNGNERRHEYYDE
jgi:hypothetical protein